MITQSILSSPIASLTHSLSLSLPPSSMASEADPSETTSFLERLFSSQTRDLSVFIPFILGLTNSGHPRGLENDPDEESAERPAPRDRIIVINPFTQGMIVIEGSSGVDSLIREIQSKEGQPPASRSAIEALPELEITETGRNGECVVCLEEWGVGEIVKEMPCKHRFHGNCIEKWLEIHGSCPVCRYQLPVEEGRQREEGIVNDDEDEGRGRRRVRREIWVSFGLNGDGRRGDSGRTPATDSTDSSSLSDLEVES